MCGTRPKGPAFWSLPVVGETYDGALNDINGQHVRPEHLFSAIEQASDGPVPEGCVGGGTGMICHDFKGGTGTASRVVEAGDWTVGALVQANHGDRERLTVDGVHVGEAIPTSEIPSAWDEEERIGSTASRIDHRDRRHGRPARSPISSGGWPSARASGSRGSGAAAAIRAATSSSRSPPRTPDGSRPRRPSRPRPISVEMLPTREITALFWGAIEATEEAILNALVAAETMTGRDGITAHALPHDRLVETMTKHGRGPNR